MNIINQGPRDNWHLVWNGESEQVNCTPEGIFALSLKEGAGVCWLESQEPRDARQGAVKGRGQVREWCTCGLAQEVLLGRGWREVTLKKQVGARL